MAIDQDTWIAVGPNMEAQVVVANVNSEQWAEESYDLSLPLSGHKWSNYVICGVRGVCDDAGRAQSVAMRMMVEG
jgi:galactokinase